MICFVQGDQPLARPSVTELWELTSVTNFKEHLLCLPPRVIFFFVASLAFLVFFI